MSDPTTQQIPIDKIDIPQETRNHDAAKLESLAQDLKEQGQLQEITVLATGDRFELIVCKGRVLAAQKLGWKDIRASVYNELSDFQK